MKIGELDIDNIRIRYEQGESMNQIAISCGTTHHTIKRALKSVGVLLRGKKESHRSTFCYTKTGEKFRDHDVYRTDSGRLCILQDKVDYRYSITLMRTVCGHCGGTLLSEKNVSAKKRACSARCQYAMQSGQLNANWTGGKIKTANGYVLVYCPEHPRARQNKVLEHRLVVEKIIGRILDEGDEVHHINCVKDDNRPENLCVCTHSEHRKVHASLLSMAKVLLDKGMIRFNLSRKVYEMVNNE